MLVTVTGVGRSVVGLGRNTQGHTAEDTSRRQPLSPPNILTSLRPLI